MTKLPTVEHYKAEFAFFGFTQTPLSDCQIRICMDYDLPIYDIGCDVSCGYNFIDIIKNTYGVEL